MCRADPYKTQGQNVSQYVLVDFQFGNTVFSVEIPGKDSHSEPGERGGGEGGSVNWFNWLRKWDL